MTGAAAPRHYSPRWGSDTRPAPPDTGGERETLSAILDWHRATFELKCSGLPPERLSERAVPPSGLSLHGLVRHLAGAERWWFRIQFAGQDVPMLYYSDDDPDQDFDRAECEHSGQITAAAASLDETGTRQSTGEPISLRRITVDMIAEYARHNGHADLLRERIDGSVGM